MHCLTGQSEENTYTTTQVTQKFVNIITSFPFENKLEEAWYLKCTRKSGSFSYTIRVRFNKDLLVLA